MTSRRIATTSALTLATLLAACGGGKDRPAAAADGDTGAAAPATQQSLSPAVGMGDSAPGVVPSTGAPAMAGDTMGARGKSAGLPPKTDTVPPAPGAKKP